VPDDNPIHGNPFYTRGHRNPQGLIYNSSQHLLYEVEHGDRTDDELNLLEKGMNYGWKTVRGFHSDNNFPGEQQAIANYVPDPRISGDALHEPLFTWCSSPQPTVANNLDWCTVAPSDGIYYDSRAIAGWKNSLLVVTLKNGRSTDMQLFRIKLNADGRTLAAPSSHLENPKTYFSEDQNLNGRLRDIAISPDGKTIYLINNGGANRDKITVYTCTDATPDAILKVYPIPVGETIHIDTDEIITSLKIYDAYGKLAYYSESRETYINAGDFAQGVYSILVTTTTGMSIRTKFVK
jgi:glucose/arabinose dehydrogenase